MSPQDTGDRHRSRRGGALHDPHRPRVPADDSQHDQHDDRPGRDDEHPASGAGLGAAEAGPRPAGRMAHLDRLKIVMVAAIIAVHGIVGYSSLEGAWAYQPVREVGLAEVTENALGTLILPAMLFVMGVFFLISGLVVPGSIDRHGIRGFVRNRLLRLGLPYVVWVLVIWPAVVYVPRWAAGWTASYWEMFLGAQPFLDAGAMWFVGVLILYSLGYAAWRAWRTRDERPASGPAPRHDGAGGPTETPGRTLALLAVGVSVATVLVRLVFPFDSHQVAELQLWQWPQYLAMFGLGVVATRRGWLRPVRDGLRRSCGIAAAVAIVAFCAMFAVVVGQGLDPGEAFADPRLGWAPMTLAALEGPLAVGASVWVLGTAQRRLGNPPSSLGLAMARGAYAAYVVQGVVLIGLALALRPVSAPAEVKALVVATGGVVGSFALGLLLVRRTPVGRVL